MISTSLVRTQAVSHSIPCQLKWLKMKVLKTVRRHYVVLGISPAQRLSKRVLGGFLLFGYLIVSQFVYFFYKADDFMESMECFCSASGSIIMFIGFAVSVVKRALLFESIANIEQLIDSSEPYSIYLFPCEITLKLNFYHLGCAYPKSEALFFKASHQIERLSETVFAVVMKIALQLYILPKCIVGYALYFITNSENKSFPLPFPMW